MWLRDPESPTRDAVRVGIEVVLLAITALVISAVAGVAFLVPLLVLGYDVGATWVFAGATAAGQVGFLLTAYVFVRRRDLRVPVEAPSRSDLVAVGGGVVLAMLAASGLSYVLFLLDVVPGSVIGEMAAADPTILLALAALSVVLIAPAEELLFRGAIQGRLRTRFGPVPSIVGSSLLFGSIHLANYTGALVPVVGGALLISAVGAILGALYERTGNLAVPVLVHATYNVVFLVASYLTVPAG